MLGHHAIATFSIATIRDVVSAPTLTLRDGGSGRRKYKRRKQFALSEDRVEDVWAQIEEIRAIKKMAEEDEAAAILLLMS